MDSRLRGKDGFGWEGDTLLSEAHQRLADIQSSIFRRVQAPPIVARSAQYPGLTMGMSSIDRR